MEIVAPFGPRIAKVKLDDCVVEALNNEIDFLLQNKDLIKKLDASKELAGNVNQEVSLRKEFILNSGVQDLVQASSKQYLKSLLAENIIPEMGHPILTSMWFVSQHKGDFNPAHIHYSDISGVIYTKIPEELEDEIKKEDHYPSVGHIDFVDGRANILARHNYLVKPEIGMMYLFPSWLMHTVYPFRSEGERRSVAFNLIVAN